MRVCLLNSTTKQVVNVVSLNKPEDHNYTPGIEVAPQHDGDIGWIWNGSGWDVPGAEELTREQLESLNRGIRNKWLRRDIDKINAVKWESFSENEKQAWSQYRQALLDVPQQETFPYDISWPTRP